jgi:hypothetical protein
MRRSFRYRLVYEHRIVDLFVGEGDAPQDGSVDSFVGQTETTLKMVTPRWLQCLPYSNSDDSCCKI